MDALCVRKIFQALKINQIVKIQTEKQELIGCLCHVDKSLNYIILDAVKDGKTNIEYTSRQMIPAEIVRFLQVVNEVNDNDSIITEEEDLSFATAQNSEELNSESDNSALAYAVKLRQQPIKLADPSVTLSDFEVKFIQDVLNAPIIIEKVGTVYDNALQDISLQQIIAVFIEPINCTRKCDIPIITIATIKTVYVLNMTTLKNLVADLKPIFESRRPLKALHDSRFVTNHFQYQYDVHFENIFDTFVAYCEVTKRKTKMNFLDILENFFKIKKDYFLTDSHCSHYNFQCSLKPQLIKKCVKRAYFVLKLQEYLQKQMLSKFYMQCNDFSQTFQEIDDNIMATEEMQLNKLAGFQNILSFGSHN